MTIKKIDDTILTGIANSIRGKLGVQTQYKPSEMADAIDTIEGGYPEPTGTKTITANGTEIDVKNYASADVAVPNSYTAEDEGKVVDNGALVSQTSQTVTQNGTYDTTTNDEIVVNVAGSGSSRLPSAYQEVEYIECDEHQFSTINESIPQYDYITIKVLYGRVGNNYYPTVMGYDSGNAFEIYMDAGKYLTKYGSLSSVTGRDIKYDIGEVVYHIAKAAQNLSSFFIGKYYGNTETGTSLFNGKIYEIQVSDLMPFDTGNIVLHFIPCYRKSDNKAGLYELVNNEFYPSEGTSDYIAGADVN